MKNIFKIISVIPLLLPLFASASMSSSSWEIDSARIGTGEVSVPSASSTNYTIDASNTAQPDYNPPTTTATPLGGTYGAAQSVTLSCDDNSGSGCEKSYYTTDGVTTPTTSSPVYSGPITISATSTLKFFSTDKANNSESPQTQIYTIDETYPITTTTSDIGNTGALTNHTSATFNFTSNKSGSTFECKLDDASFAPCTSPQTVTGLDDGMHAFIVRATHLGNTEPSPIPFDWTVDTTPPTITNSSSISAYTNNASPTVTFTASEDSSITYTNCPANDLPNATQGINIITFSDLADGTYANCQFKMTDAAGNDSDSFTIPTFTVDTQAPNIRSLTPNNQTFPATTTSTTLTANTSENAFCKYSTNGYADYASMSAFDNTNSTTNTTLITGLNPGQVYDYYVLCKDAAGNPSSQGHITFSVSPIPAATSIVNKAKIQIGRATNKFKDTFHIATSKFKLKQTDPSLVNGTVKIYKNGSLWKTISADAQGAWSASLKLSNNASKTIKLVFSDALGNILGKQSAKVKIDTEAPKFTKFITLNYSIQRGGTLYWEAHDNDKAKNFKVYFNGKTKTVTSAKFTVPVTTPPGTYTIKVRAYDEVGNSSSKSVQVKVTW